jgi:hypothetical protein
MPGQSQDLVGAQLDVPGSAHPPDLPRYMLAVDDQTRAAVVELKLNVAAGSDAQGLSDLERDRDLPFLGHSHIGKTTK